MLAYKRTKILKLSMNFNILTHTGIPYSGLQQHTMTTIQVTLAILMYSRLNYNMFTAVKVTVRSYFNMLT